MAFLLLHTAIVLGGLALLCPAAKSGLKAVLNRLLPA